MNTIQVRNTQSLVDSQQQQQQNNTEKGYWGNLVDNIQNMFSSRSRQAANTPDEIFDFIMGPLERTFNSQSKFIKFVAGFLILILWIVMTLFSLTRVTLMSMSKSVGFVNKVPGIGMISKFPIQIVLFLNFVFAHFISGLHVTLGRLAIFLTGSIMVMHAFENKCLKYFSLIAGLIVMLAVLIKSKILGNLIKSPAILTLFNYLTIVVGALLIIEVFWSPKCNLGDEQKNRGMGDSTSLFYTK